MKSSWRSFFQSYSCIVGLVAHVVILLPILSMLSLPAGTSVRPMGWAMLAVVVTLFSFPVGIVTALCDAAVGKRRLAVLGFALCSMPFFSASIFLHVLAFLKGLHVAE